LDWRLDGRKVETVEEWTGGSEYHVDEPSGLHGQSDGITIS